MARLAWPSEPVIIIQCLLTITLLSLHFASAGPTGQRSYPQCLSFCKEAKNFVYEPGTTYVYDYATDIETSILQGSQHKSHVRVTARVELEAVSTCDLKLQLKNVHFEDLATGSSEYTRLDSFKEQEDQLEQHSLLFGFQDGRIEQVCANQEDETWVVNVKRGVVSMIQNSLEDLSSSSFTFETDINGKCPTEYNVDGTVWGGGVSYKKFKDLTKCTSRQSQFSAIQSVPYSSSSPIQNIPLLSGKLECSQTVRNKRIENVVCQEEQRFKPFEDGNSGALTTIAQSLVYSSEHPAQRHTDENEVFIKKTLLFESEEPVDGKEDNSKRLLQFIELLDSASSPQVTPAAPQLFSDFVVELRSSSESSIRMVFNAIQGTPKQKYLMEAMPLVGTSSSLALLRDLTLNDLLGDNEQKSWLTALAFIKHPTVEMLKAVTPLLQESAPSMEALLGISALVNSYCKYHTACNEEVIVNDILEKITSRLGSDCRVEDMSPDNVRQMVLRLKAIGNAGVLPVTEQMSGTPIVIKCLQDRINPLEVRLAALDSLRRLSCQAYDKQSVLSQFTDVHENTEIRIKAFLALMRCVDRHTMELIKSVLYTEPVNQVASFVWTFLTNLQETNRPEKQDIRDLMSNEFLKNKFSTDPRKFSRNYEASSYWEDWNLGAGIDSNIIFTEESFLPKSGMVNLTVQLFGESVNIFEVGLRTHGLEQLLEKFFGPQGYLPDTRVTEFLNSNRAKRDTSSNQDTDGLGYLYEQAKLDNEEMPGGSFYSRMFGHEITYKKFEVSDKTAIPNVVDDSGKSWFHIRNILDNLSIGKKFEYSESMILFDVGYSVATCSGFPLNLNVHAAATVAMTAKGKFNVGRFLETKELDVQGTLKPSSMVNVDGTLAIKIGSSQKQLLSGLKLHNTLRSSTAVELILLMKGKNVFQASVNVPQNKQEIIDISSQLLAVGPNGQALITENSGEDFDAKSAPAIITDYVSDGCSSQYWSDLVGMKLCMEMNIPSKMSFTPVHPVFLKLYLEKIDDFTGYTVDYRYDSDPSSTKLNAVFDTPGSFVNRRVSADFLLDRGMGKIAGALESAMTSLRAEGIYTRFQKNLELSLVSHERTSFLLSTGLRSDGNIVKPHFLITWHARPLVDLKGTIDMTPQPTSEDKVAIEMNLKHLTETPVKITGEIIGSGEVKDATLSIESYILTGNIRSQLKRKPEHWSTKTSMEYSWKRGRVHTADLSAKFQRSRKGSLSKLLVTAGFSSTQFPDNSADFYWETQTSGGFCENSLKLGWGKTTWEGHTLFSRQNQVDHSELRLETSLMCSKFNVDYRLEFAHRTTTEGFKTKFLGRTAIDTEFNANMEYISAVDDLLKKSLEAAATWPNTDYSLKASFIEKQRGDFEAELLVHLNNTRDLKATALYINRSNNLRLDHNIEFRARGFTQVPLSGSIGFSATEKQSHLGLQVQFEGKKPYSSRISTSFDYSHTKYSHKLEGKVTLNEKKYNGEIFYLSNRQGGKNLTVDLQLENHIYIEATLTGMLPNPMLATLLVIPDKDNEPNSKVRLEGNLDPNSVALMLNYFGDELSVGGRYDDTSVLAEVIWPQNQKLMVSIAVPKFSFEDTEIELDALTPFEGFETITFDVQHTFGDAKLKSVVKGVVGDTEGEWNLAASAPLNEINISTDLTITGYPKYEGNLLVLRKSKRKSLQISMQAGEKQSAFEFDFIRLDEGYLGKINFHGCSFFPKIVLEVNHQFSVSRVSTYSTKVQWSEDVENPKELVFQVKHQNYPLSIDGLFTSPWSPVKQVEASLVWDADGANRQLSVSTKESATEVNTRIQLNVVGSMQNFRHELDGEWYSKTMRITLSGSLQGWSDSNLHTIIKLPGHHISYDLLSKKQSEKYLGEFRADVDSAITSAGIKWDFGSDASQERVASVWGQIPKYSPVSATLELINTNTKKTTKVKVIKNETAVIDMVSVVQITGARHWDIDVVLKSTAHAIPSVSLSSKQNMLDLKQIRHKTELTLIPVNEESFWLNNYVKVRRATVDLSVDNVEDVQGAVIFGDNEFVVTGKIQKSDDNKGYATKIIIASNTFNELNFTGSYQNEDDEFSVSGELARYEEIIFNVDVDAGKTSDQKSGKIMFSSAYTPSLEGFISISSVGNWNLTTYLLKDAQSVFDLNANGMITSSVGLVRGKLTSVSFPSIANLQLDVDYKFAKTSVDGKVRFQDNIKVHTAKLESSWGDHTKQVKGSFDSTIKVSFAAALEGMSQLVAHAFYNGEKLGEISITYRPEQADFSLGKHGVYIVYTDKSGVAQNFNFVVGLDSKKIFVNVQTPFQNWTDVVVDGQISSSSITKGIKFLLQRESESIQGAFESKNSRKTGTLQISAELSVIGFSKLRQILLETAQVTDINGLSAVNPQTFTFQLTWSSSNFNVKVETPVDVLNRLSFSGNWELKKPQKFLIITGQINENQYDLKANVHHENENKKGKLSLSSDDYSIQVDYDFSNDYQSSLLIETPNQQWNFGGKLIVNPNLIGFEMTTPFKNFESVSISAEQEFPATNQGRYLLSWDINGQSDKIEIKYEFDQGRVEMRATTPYSPWNSVVLTVIYDTPFKHFTFHSQRGDGQEVKINFEMDSSGNMTTFESPATASIHIAIETPVENFEDIKFSLLYNRNNLIHSANISVSRNDGETEGKLNLMFQHSDPVALDISAFLTSPFLASKATAHASLLVDPNGESTVSAHVQANGKRYEMYGLSQLTDTITKLEMRTSLPFLRQVKFSVKKATTINLHGAWTGNNKHVEVHGDVFCTGFRSSRVSFNVSTPTDLMGSFGFEGEIASNSGLTNAKLVFQNHEVRWLAKVERVQEPGKEDWRLQVNTPLVGYKHVVISLKHSKDSLERKVVATVEVNKKEMSMGLCFKNQQLDMTLTSQLSYLPVQAKITANWENNLILAVSTSTGNNEYGTAFHLNLQGISNGEFDFAISSMEHLNTAVAWKFQGDCEQGQGWLNVKNSLIGRKSLRSSWKNQKWQAVVFDLWTKTGLDENENGVTLQYKVVPHAHYGSIKATVNYTLAAADDSETILLEASIDEQASHLNFDSVLKTPFEDFEIFQAKGQLKMKNEIGFNIDASLNDEKLASGNFHLIPRPLNSVLSVELDIPLVTDPLKLNCSYDMTSANKDVTVLFQQNVHVMDLKLGVTVPSESNLVDIKLQAESTVPMMPLDVSGSFRMEYAVSNDGTRQIAVHLNGNEVGDWKLLANLRPKKEKMHSKIVFEGPLEILPTLMAEFNFAGNMREGVTGDATVILDGIEITSRLHIDNTQWHSNFKYVVGSSQRYAGDGQVIFNGDHTQLEVRYNDDQEYDLHIAGHLNITTETKLGSGIVTVMSGGNSAVPISFEMVMENHGNILIIGTSNEKNIRMEANLKGNNGLPWVNEGETRIQVAGNVFGGENLSFELQSNHYIRDQEFSLNVTTGDDFNLESYAKTTGNVALFAKVDWFEMEEIKLDIKLRPSNVDVYLKVQPYVNTHLLAVYGSLGETTFTNGVLLLNGQKSTLNTSLTREGSRTTCTAALDIPAIKQKVDMEIVTVLTAPQNLRGEVNVKVNDQDLQISGSLKTQVFDSGRGDRYIERVLQITSNFTTDLVNNIGLELFVRKPLQSYYTFNIVGTLNFNDQVSTISGGYELPSQESPVNAGFFAKLQSTYLPSDENYECFLKIFGKTLKKIEGKLNYKVTRFDVLWDFLMPTSVLSFSYSGKTDDGERLLLQIESIFDPTQNVRLNINCHGWDTHYTFRTSLIRQATTVTGQLFIDAPQILANANEYKITVTTTEDGSYALEASAVRGRLVMELVGDASISLNNLNVVVKAMGSYGSHYAMIVGNRNGGGQFGFELTAESSSLLVGKRVNVRGNMTVDERSITTVLQCRARRNIHELSASWKKEEDGAGKVTINLVSPSVDPAKLNAEWSSKGKEYFGKLAIQVFNKNHDAEFGLNLKDFEGKLHIVSPLLPSNEFNFHVKSIVNTQNVDLMGDIRIRGSHWRLEGVAAFTGLRDMTFKIEARTPFAFFDRLTLGIKCVKDEVYLEVHTPVKYIPNVMFKLGGIENLEQGGWYRLKPNLVVSVPNGKYTAMASLETPQQHKAGVLHILLQYVGKESKTVEAYAEISPLKTFKLQMDAPGELQIKVVTPFDKLKQVKLHVEGNINSKRSGKLQITGALNSHEGKFDASFDNSNGNMQALTRLVTNIPKYEKSAFAIAIETFQGIGNGKSFHVEFRKPDWENLFRLDADYRYKFESLLNLEGEVNVNMDSYMNLPPLHAHLTSGMKNSRYSGAVEGAFGSYHPTLKVEAENLEARITVFIEGKAGENDRYNVVNTFEMVPLQTEFSFKEKLHWRGEQVLDLQVFHSDEDQLCEGHLHLFTPWGPISSKGALSPITFPTINEALSMSQLLKNANVTLSVHFEEKKIIGLEIVSRDGMRLFEIHNPIRPVSLSVGVEKVDWHSLRLKAGVCWDLKVPEKSSLGLNAFLYRRSTGMNMGVFIAGAEYGIIIANFEHFFISSKLAQNLMIKWNAHAGRMGDIGYTLNITDKSTGFKRLIDYGLQLVVPSRSVVISGSSESSDQKYAVNNFAVAWDALRYPEKILKVNISSQRSTTWRTSTISRVIKLQHVAWEEPIVFSADQILIHEMLKKMAIKVQPSSNPASHLSWSAFWENGDWSSFVTTLAQPSSKIDIEAKYNITEQTKLLKLTHMLSTGDNKLFAVSWDRSLNSQHLAIKSGDLSKPRTLSALSSQSSHGEHSVKATLLQYQVSGRVHTSLPYLDLVLRQDNANKLHILCGLPHAKEIVFKASRSQFTKTINDASFLLRLNSSNLLSTRVHWRPDLFDEIAEYDWLRGSKNVLNSMLPSFDEFSSAIRAEVEGHWVLFSSPVKNFLSSFYEFSAIEMSMILQELQVVGARIQQLYAKNAFYMKDIVEVFNASVSPLLKAVKNAVHQVRHICKTVCQFMMNAGKMISNLVLKYYGRLESHVMKAWEDVEQVIVNLWNRNAEWVQMVSEELEEFLDALIEALEGKIEMLEEKLMAVGFVKTILQLYRDYATWLDEIPIDDYVEAIEEFFQIKVWDKLEAVFGPYLEAIRNALDDQYIKELLETPPIPYIRFILKQTKNALVKLWNVIELEEKLKDLVRHALKNVDSLMQRNFPTWQLEWDIDNGIIEYDQSLSLIQWTDFTQSPRWRLQAQETEEVNQITNLYYQIMDYIENLKPIFDMRIRDVLPPFGGLAMMAGDHHYYTFDKKYFRFAGECSYVLVVDLLHNGFSFIVNYETRDGAIRKKSYTIALAEHNIEFDVANFKVTVDNRKVELPTKVDTVYIRRQETRLDIYDVRGYQITCTLSPSVCTFSTSGWYYGKLAGLLGTYDNELINDFRSPDGEIISDIPTFAYSWRVGKSRNQCRMKNFARDETEPADVDNICYDLLTNRNSPLRPCFNTVDTTIFMEMCKYDVSRNINSASRTESACTSMSAYVTECQKHNVDVWMPPTCVRCKLENGKALTTGENATLQTNSLEHQPPSSSDIVILLEEKECMDQLDISSAIGKLEAALRAEGITDNRYALIGFGGHGIHLDAHLQTSSANVWSHSTLFKVPEKAGVVGMKKSDLYSAVHFASTMTYRAGVSKTLIAITCGDEKCGDSVRYADTLTLLVENDFKLHMITPKPLTLKGKKKQDESNRILGFDANGVYTVQHAKRAPLVADPSFKRHLNLPKDLCTPLAVETNGTRFTSDNLTKKLLDVWARRVAQTAQPSECQRCECVPDKNGGSRLMCHQCVSPSLWKFMEEWKNYQSQEIDDVLALEMLETEPFLLPPS